MNIVVCIKQVPDTASVIKVKDGQIDYEGLTWVVNPYDEYALEEALRIKEKQGSGKVTLLSLGPERVKEALKTGLAMGADEAVHLKDPAFEGLDSFTTAKVLAAALKKTPFDLIWCGWKGVDADQGVVGISLAELLDLPHVSFVTKVEIAPDGKSATLEKEIEGGHEVVETNLPALFTAQKGLNEPRYPTLKGIMAVKSKIIQEWSAVDLGVSTAELEPLAEVVGASLPPARKVGRMLSGTPQEMAAELVRLLHEEANVI
ncbi:MAG: electron transfer flavoprotein subunit beta/FixA family protein [Chloroflexi bacterium]|nr:electron transfer flavoprotein subunit beta/FixA family protein [Chloroflexota bacterium]